MSDMEIKMSMMQFDEAYGGDLVEVHDAIEARVRRWGLKLSLDGAARTFGRLTRSDYESGANPRTTRGVPFVTLWFSSFINAAMTYVSSGEKDKDPKPFGELQKKFLEENRMMFTAMTVVARELLHERRRHKREIEALHAAAAAAGVVLQAEEVDGYVSSDDETMQAAYQEKMCGENDFLDDGFANCTVHERRAVLNRIVAAWAASHAKKEQEAQEPQEEPQEEKEAQKEQEEQREEDSLADALERAELNDAVTPPPLSPPRLARSCTQRELFFDDEPPTPHPRDSGESDSD